MIVYFTSTLVFLVAWLYGSGTIDDFPMPKYVEITHEVIKEAVDKLEKKHHLQLVGVGEGLMDRVNHLSLEFEFYEPLDRQTARKLLVECVNEFLEIINRNEEIRPYLKVYPFTPAEAEIVIFSVSENQEPFWDPYITVVANETYERSGRTVAAYKTESPDKPFGYAAKYEEDYAEAVRMVKGEE